MGMWTWLRGGSKENAEKPQVKSRSKASAHSAPLPGRMQRLTEVIGFPNIDQGTIDDDKFYKKLGPVTELDLPLAMLAKSQRLSLLLYRINVLAWRAIELV